MSRVVVMAGSTVDLRSSDPLAVGGEAAVYAVGRRAIKVWHAPVPSRVRKLRALLARRGALPEVVVAPDEEVRDAGTDEVVGFSMPLLDATFEPIAILGRTAQGAARGASVRVALGLLARLLEALRQLHAMGVVVGDLSDQNVAVDVSTFGSPASSPSMTHSPSLPSSVPSSSSSLRAPRPAPVRALPVRILDSDSLQLDGLPCEVSTEAFLDPALYGPDVTRPCATEGGRARVFTPASDGYAFAVLLFRALTGVHPYGGALDGLPTLPRRALARASVLRPDVKTPPRVRLAIDLLDAPLRARFEAVFERGDREDFDVDALERAAASLIVCGCGLEIPDHLLPCPRCAPRTRVAPRVVSGRLRSELLLVAAGPVVAVAESEDGWVAVAIEAGRPVLHIGRNGVVARETLCGDAARAGWDVALGARTVAVAPRGASGAAPLYAAAIGPRGLIHATSTTDRSAGTAVMAAAHDVVFRVARGTVLVGRVTAAGLVERPVATVVRGQARLFGAAKGDEPIAIAVGATLGVPRWELLGARGTTSLEPPLLSSAEVVRDVAAYGDADGVMVLARTRAAGRWLVRAVRFDPRGRRLDSHVMPVDGRGADEVIAGGAYRRGAVLLATAGGLVREEPGAAPRAFVETAPFGSAGASVALARGGVLLADGPNLRRLELS